MNAGRSIATFCRFGGFHGWGHLARSSALMAEAQSRGWRTALWTSSDIELMTSSQRSVFDAVSQIERYDFETFAEQRGEADVVFIDEMYLPDAFYDSARDFVDKLPKAKLVAMDDMMERSMSSVDLVVNTELGLRSAEYRAPAALLGERYCLIRQGFRSPIKKAWPNDKRLIPVLIMIGGTDPFGCSFDVLNALGKLDKYAFAPVLISGDGNEYNSLHSKLSEFDEFRMEIGLDDFEMASEIESCSFGVIGCGSSMFEFGALKTPFVGLSLANNQEASARRIEDEWVLPVARRSSEGLSANDLCGAIGSLVDSLEKGRIVEFGEIDLLGTRRVMQEIEALFS